MTPPGLSPPIVDGLMKASYVSPFSIETFLSLSLFQAYTPLPFLRSQIHSILRHHVAVHPLPAYIHETYRPLSRLVVQLAQPEH